MRRGIWLAILWCVFSTKLALASAQPVEDFMKLKPKWESLIGSKFLLQGRVSGVADTVFGFQGCSMVFRCSEPVPKLTPGKDVLEVSGELARDAQSGGLFFRVASFRKTDSDERQYERRRLLLIHGDAASMSELGDWATARGEFYRDEDLLRKGLQCYRDGVRIERGEKQNQNPDAFERLAKKAIDRAKDENLRQELLHESVVMRYSELMLKPKVRADDLYGLALSISKFLPGFDQPLIGEEAELRLTYWRSPVEVYDSLAPSKTVSAADSEQTRRKLHRVLYSEMILESLRRRVRPDGGNGKEIADEMALLLPDRPNLPAIYRDQEVAFRVAQVEKLSLAELNALRQELVALNRNDIARDVFHRWFAHREATLKQQGADGLLELAALYQTTYEGPRDKRRIVIDLLKEVDRLRPGLEEVREALATFGLQFRNGRWMTDGEVREEENSPLNRAIREGKVITGMTPDQVRKAIGSPTSVTRCLTPRQVVEYWVYRETKLSVKFTRPAQRAEATVSAVLELNVGGP